MAQQITETNVRAIDEVASVIDIHGEITARSEQPLMDAYAAAAEIEHWPEYDYVLVNSDLDQSLDGLQAILIAERLKRERQTGMADFVAEVLAGL